MKGCRYQRHADPNVHPDRQRDRPDNAVAARIRAFGRMRRLTVGCVHPPGGLRCQRHPRGGGGVA